MIADICFTDALFQSAQEVFETMIFMGVEDCTEQDGIEGDALLGSITFTGEIEGCMSVCCANTCAGIIAANMLGQDTDVEIAEDDIRDAMGEVANLVMGSLKAILLNQGIGNLEVSIPCVVSGKRMTSSLGDDAMKVQKLVNIDEAVAELTLLYRKKA